MFVKFCFLLASFFLVVLSRQVGEERARRLALLTQVRRMEEESLDLLEQVTLLQGQYVEVRDLATRMMLGTDGEPFLYN